MEILQWLGAHEGIVGTLLGAALGFVAAYTNQWLQRRRQLRIAMMRVATDLRHWLGSVASNIGDTVTFVESDGATGSMRADIPSLRFEATLDVVCLLDDATARRIFDLIHEKDDANAAIDATSEYVSYEEAVDVFRGEAARLFLTGFAAYKDVCGRIDWSSDAFPHSTASMQLEVARLGEFRRKQEEPNNWPFAERQPEPEK